MVIWLTHIVFYKEDLKAFYVIQYRLNEVNKILVRYSDYYILQLNIKINIKNVNIKSKYHLYYKINMFSINFYLSY